MGLLKSAADSGNRRLRGDPVENRVPDTSAADPVPTRQQHTEEK